MPTKKGGKVRDKWRDKRWVVVHAPSVFANQPIAYIPITDEKHAIGRVIECTLFDLWHTDPQQHAIKLYFQIERIEGDYAYTYLKGHEYTKEFIKSMVRRGSSMVNFIKDYTTADGYTFRIYTIAFTQKKVNTSKKHDIRKVMDEVLSREVPMLNIDQFIQAVVGPKLNADIHSRVKDIINVRFVAVWKTKLLGKKQPIIQVQQEQQAQTLDV